MAHRVDPIAGRVVEVVRLAEGPSADVQGAGVVENAVRKRLEEDAGAELERRGTETLDALADLAVPHRRDAGPRAALADRRWEDELERRALAEARTSGAQVLLQLAEVQPGQHAVDRHVDIGIQEAVDARDGLVMGVLPGAEERGARRRTMRVQRDDRPLEAVLGGAACEAVLREAPTVRVDVPREAVGLQPFHDRPEAGVDRRLAAGDDRAPEAGAMEERGTPEERLGRMEEERRVSRVATHRTVVVALLAEPKEDGALRRDGLVVGDLLLEEPRCGCFRKVLARRSHNELRSAD